MSNSILAAFPKFFLHSSSLLTFSDENQNAAAAVFNSNWLKMCWRERRGFTSDTEHIFVDKRWLLNHVTHINKAVQNKVHRWVTNNFNNDETPRASNWHILQVKHCAALPNWLKTRWSERRDFTPNAEHAFVNKRALLKQIECVHMTSRRHAP